MQAAIAVDFEKDLRAERIRRIRHTRKLERKPEARALELRKCRQSLLHWVDNWATTYDPRRARGKTLPFKPFPRQREYLLWREERRSQQETGVCEKSRDAGMTWLNVYHQTWCWLFEPQFAGGFGSRKLELVDTLGDPDSIFEKIRIQLRSMPSWMLPAGFSWKTCSLNSRLINPANGSTITGEGGDNIGRGGRKSIYDVDEAAFLARPMQVDAALSNNTNTVFYTSSANGPTGPFFQRATNLPREQVFRSHWLEDPRKNYWVVPNDVGGISATGKGAGAPEGAIYPWYEQQKAKLDPVVVASEIDIDYQASVENIAIPGSFVLPAISSSLYARTGVKVASLDVADEGGDDNVFMVRDGSIVETIHSWNAGNTVSTAYQALFYCLQYNVNRLVYDDNGVGATVRGILEKLESLSKEYLGRYGDIAEFAPLLDALHRTAKQRRGHFTLPFEFVGFPAGSRDMGDRRWPEFSDRSSKEIFLNYRAETTWLVRRRFERVTEVKDGTIAHDPHDLISIPNHSRLISQIAWPKRQFTDTGLIKIESKQAMKARGLKSPDFLDALVMLFYQPTDDPKKNAADWLNKI